MKKFVASMLIAMTTLSGMALAQPPQPAAPAAAAPASDAPSPLVIGGGVILLGLAGFAGYRVVRRRDAAAKAAAARAARPAKGGKGGARGTATAPASAGPALPPGFNSALFLRNAKASFIRMQAAWDKADSADLRLFTTPEVFAELSPQMQAGASVTEVVSIEAELLGVDTIGAAYVASVRFTGMLQVAPGAPAPLVEVWNMSKPVSAGAGGSDWMLAGIHQLS